MVIGYIRVSTEKQNVSNQKDEILRFASLNDWTIDRWVTEVVSGKRDVKSR
jgi:DNA invertase Pin-like site-specific DNA recombinase